MTIEEIDSAANRLRNQRSGLLRVKMTKEDMDKHNAECEKLICLLADMTPKHGAALDEIKDKVWGAVISVMKDGRYAVMTGKFQQSYYTKSIKEGWNV